MISVPKSVTVAGGGGFIGGWLVSRLRELGIKHIRAIDIKPLSGWYQVFDDVENLVLDLRDKSACERACEGAEQVFNLACDMGGMGFIEAHRAECMI